MNKYLYGNKIKDFVKDIVIDELYNYEDTKHYSCDLAYSLLERYNIDGVYFYNNYEATKFIQDNFFDFGEIVDEIENNLGAENIPNVFENPDGFCVVCFLEVASYLLSQCKLIEENWDNEIVLSKENIEIIESQLEEV